MSERIVLDRRQNLRQIFAIPAFLGLLSVIGLISALVGDGVWDALSWIALAIPIVLCAYYLLKPRNG